MMISPYTFANQYSECTYKELLKVRDELLEEIYDFEKGDKDNIALEEMVCPSPEVVYQCNLEYLSEICKMIALKYNSEFINNEE